MPPRIIKIQHCHCLWARRTAYRAEVKSTVKPTFSHTSQTLPPSKLCSLQQSYLLHSVKCALFLTLYFFMEIQSTFRKKDCNEGSSISPYNITHNFFSHITTLFHLGQGDLSNLHCSPHKLTSSHISPPGAQGLKRLDNLSQESPTLTPIHFITTQQP